MSDHGDHPRRLLAFFGWVGVYAEHMMADSRPDYRNTKPLREASRFWILLIPSPYQRPLLPNAAASGSDSLRSCIFCRTFPCPRPGLAACFRTTHSGRSSPRETVQIGTYHASMRFSGRYAQVLRVSTTQNLCISPVFMHSPVQIEPFDALMQAGGRFVQASCEPETELHWQVSPRVAATARAWR